MGILLIAGCAGTSSETAPATPGVASSGTIRGYKVGKPYQVKGVWYYPQVDYAYSEEGIASWYGPGFDGRATANGELYDMNDVTAAHKTLPLPTIVRVTNLENGRSIKVRVNDRGPFVGDRIIDLSRRSAQLLGFYGAGTARVRVEVIEDESRQVLADLAAASGTTVAEAAPPVPVLASAAEPAVPAADTTQAPIEIGRSPVAQAPVFGGAAWTAADVAPVESAPFTPPPATAPVEAVEIPPVYTGASPVLLADFRDTTDAPGWTPTPASFVAPASAPASAPSRAAAVAPRTPPVPPAGNDDRRVAWVQAGAFADADRVDQAKRRLQSVGPVVTSASKLGGRQLVRVRVGPFDTEAEAERTLASVSRAGFPECRVVFE